jgi:hypothetical protein
LLSKELGQHQYGIFISSISPELTELKSYTWYRMLIKYSLILQLFGIFWYIRFGLDLFYPVAEILFITRLVSASNNSLKPQMSFIVVKILPHHTTLKIKHCLNTEVQGTKGRRKEGGDNCSVWEGGSHGNVNYRGGGGMVGYRSMCNGRGTSGEQGLHGITWEPCLSKLPSVYLCIAFTIGWTPLARE